MQPGLVALDGPECEGVAAALTQTLGQVEPGNRARVDDARGPATARATPGRPAPRDRDGSAGKPAPNLGDQDAY
jgi:hypothetical protein